MQTLERRKMRCTLSKSLRCFLRWWPIFVAVYFGIVAYFPPATFSNSLSVNLFSWFAWGVFACAVLALVFPHKLIFRASMCALAVSRSIAAIATTVYEFDSLYASNLFWTKFLLLNGTLALNLLWVAMYAVTIPYMKEIQCERRN